MERIWCGRALFYGNYERNTGPFTRYLLWGHQIALSLCSHYDLLHMRKPIPWTPVNSSHGEYIKLRKGELLHEDKIAFSSAPMKPTILVTFGWYGFINMMLLVPFWSNCAVFTNASSLQLKTKLKMNYHIKTFGWTGETVVHFDVTYTKNKLPPIIALPKICW